MTDIHISRSGCASYALLEIGATGYRDGNDLWDVVTGNKISHDGIP